MRRTFAVTALALFMFSLDRTVVLTALPDTGAALGDRFGRRRMSLLMPLASRWLAESRGPNASLDVSGVLLATIALFSLVWGLVESDPAVAGLGLCEIAAFVWWESRASAPMLPLRFFASRTFAVANLASLLGYGAIFGSLFLLGSLMQARFGYGAFESGLRLLPWAGVSLALAWLAWAAGGGYWPLVVAPPEPAPAPA